MKTNPKESEKKVKNRMKIFPIWSGESLGCCGVGQGGVDFQADILSQWFLSLFPSFWNLGFNCLFFSIKMLDAEKKSPRRY